MRKKNNSGLKKILWIYGGMLLVLIISCIIVYVIYNNKVKEAAKRSLLAAEKITEIVPNNSNMLEQASAEMSKTINEAINEMTDEEIENEVQIDITQDEVINAIEKNQNTEPVVVEELVKPLEFIYPVEGEMLKEFSVENLVFSETLQEWIVHKGIDIKAPRTTIVKAAEEGTVLAIKNDPRYGLTVIVEHREGYKTVYSNLLTTEFVKEGEKVSKCQSLGTIGNSAAFEISDEPHLHFEMLKDEEAIDPTLYLK